ncbi:MAG: sugar phosphate nucleotidyltransferase [Bacilli bacterium]
MNILLLSGGSGKRLWPLSNEIRSKQFIKLFKTEDGQYESMVQRIYRQIKAANPDASITIATSKKQVSIIRNQLCNDVGISVEPCRRDTFPAIVLAASYFRDVKGLSEDESVVVCPVDPLVGSDYFACLQQMLDELGKSDSNLVLMGVEPTYPSEKYGYIIPKGQDIVSGVSAFKEKPSERDAKKYISKGALWNGGVFAFKLKYIMKIAHGMYDFSDYRDLYSKYNELTKISFDYAVVEKESKIKVVRFSGKWKDLGTWNTLTEAMEENVIGKAIIDGTSSNVHVINELNVPILAVGLKNVVITASPEGILISDKTQSSFIKPYVDNFEQQTMFAEKSWGSYLVLDVENESLTVKVTLNPGQKMNYHSHNHRDEVWIVISGSGSVIVNDAKKVIKVGDVVSITAGMCHTIIAETELKIIEVQIGKDISVEDKVKHTFPAT